MVDLPNADSGGRNLGRSIDTMAFQLPFLAGDALHDGFLGQLRFPLLRSPRYYHGDNCLLLCQRDEREKS